jgi:beta-alanine--pyruvate transaminase
MNAPQTPALHPDLTIDHSSHGPLGQPAAWLPFTANRRFQSTAEDRTMVSAQGNYYTNASGHRLFDCLSGMWCCPAGHAHPKLVEAFTQQAKTLDYAPAFQITSPQTLKLAQRIADMAPAGMGKVFFVNSGSEAVDTALKMALGYHRMKGEASRFRMIGRERGYHGVGLGGLAVGGIPANRKMFGPLLMPGTDHLRHPWNPEQMAFSKGQPDWGTDLALDLERLVALHDASSIAAVIVEPVQGSTGVLVPPKGYLQKLREICTKHGILLIFDEVITGFGRLGTPFAAQYFDVQPDMITFAKAVSNGVVPLGGVIVRDEIQKAFMTGPEHMIEFFHGYTYSGHPMATAVANATLDLYAEEGLFERAQRLSPVLEAGLHSLKGTPGITDIRNIGLMGAIDLEPIAGKPGLRATEVFERGLKTDLLLRFTGDTLAFAPPFTATESEIGQMVEAVKKLVVQ